MNMMYIDKYRRFVKENLLKIEHYENYINKQSLISMARSIMVSEPHENYQSDIWQRRYEKDDQPYFCY